MRWTPVVLLVGCVAIAHATPQDAEILKGEAEAAAKQNDFVTAAAKYKAAYAADPRADLICNVGVAYFKAKDLPRAQLFLSRCLERGSALEAKFVDNVRAVLGSVENNLRAGDFTPVDIIVDPSGTTIRIDTLGADESFVGSRVVWLPKGTHSVKATAEGYLERVQPVETAGHDKQTVAITLEKKPVVETLPTGSATEQGSGSGSNGGSAIEPPPPLPIVEPAQPSVVPAVLASAGTVAALAVAIVARGKANDAADRARLALGLSIYDDDVADIHTWNTVFVTGVAVGIVGAGASAYLWYRTFHRPSTHVEVQPASGGGAVMSLAGRW